MIILQREQSAPASLVGAQQNSARPQPDRSGTANLTQYFIINPLPDAPLPGPSPVRLNTWLGTAFIQYP
jgi:hypothetical protein